MPMETVGPPLMDRHTLMHKGDPAVCGTIVIAHPPRIRAMSAHLLAQIAVADPLP
jgi:hypothetical protein